MGDQGRESKRADAPKREVRFAPINGHRQLGGARPISAAGLIRCGIPQRECKCPRRDRGETAGALGKMVRGKQGLVSLQGPTPRSTRAVMTISQAIL